MNTHILAIATYGSQRVTHPHTGRKVSAYKMSYSSAASAVLLALYGDRARDVSSKRASYHYIQIDAETTVRKGYLLFKVSDAALARAETLTRAHPSTNTGCWRWLDRPGHTNNGWHRFPSSASDHYTPPKYREGPSFNPSGMRIVSASSGEAEAAVSGITVEVSQRSVSDTPWWWISGDTYPHKDTLKRWGCRWSRKRRAWYYIGEALPDAVQQLVAENAPPEPPETPSDVPLSDDDHDPCSLAEASAVLGVPIASKSTERPTPEPDDNARQTATETDADEEPASSVRVVKPTVSASDDDLVSRAVRGTRASSLSVRRPHPRPQRWRIPQSACGELTGSISGSVWCYGWAVHAGVCVFVNMGGPRMAVEAIRAKMSKGDIVNCVPWDGPSVELTAGEGETGMYTAYLQSIPEAKFASLILCHEWLTLPNYNGKSTTFIVQATEAQAVAQLHHHVTKLVKVPVFPDWTDYLWRAGKTAMLVRPTRTGGDITLWTIDLDADAWTRLITGGLSTGVIMLPSIV